LRTSYRSSAWLVLVLLLTLAHRAGADEPIEPLTCTAKDSHVLPADLLADYDLATKHPGTSEALITLAKLKEIKTTEAECARAELLLNARRSAEVDRTSCGTQCGAIVRSKFENSKGNKVTLQISGAVL
jgi:hypothetical protein